MSKIDTLTEFLEAGGLAPQYYDMGRRIKRLERKLILDFEYTEIPYPQPLQQQAWIGLVLHPDDLDRSWDPLIWFIRFPLDEQGKLNLAARDDFMFQLMERLGSTVTGGEEQKQEIASALEQNPYAFQPKQERLAAIHARLTVDLRQPPSRYYDHAKKYFSGKLGWDQWSFIGYQGIADMAARHGEDDNESCLISAIPQLPPPPLEALCHVLEQESISAPLAEALLYRCRNMLKEDHPDPQVITAALRGISCSVSQQHRHEMLIEVLSHPVAKRTDVLAAIAGRCWEDLDEDEIRVQFLEQLAANDHGQAFFQQILTDLLYLADSRAGLLESLRTPNRSERLSHSIGEFFNQIHQA
jgi:hypothetical protein